MDLVQPFCCPCNHIQSGSMQVCSQNFKMYFTILKKNIKWGLSSGSNFICSNRARKARSKCTATSQLLLQLIFTSLVGSLTQLLVLSEPTFSNIQMLILFLQPRPLSPIREKIQEVAKSLACVTTTALECVKMYLIQHILASANWLWHIQGKLAFVREEKIENLVFKSQYSMQFIQRLFTIIGGRSIKINEM